MRELELSYKAIGLHLLFLYRMGKRTEAVYWERIREEISDGVHDQLKDEMLNYQKKCKRCGKGCLMTHVFKYVTLVIIEGLERRTDSIKRILLIITRIHLIRVIGVCINHLVVRFSLAINAACCFIRLSAFLSCTTKIA